MPSLFTSSNYAKPPRLYHGGVTVEELSADITSATSVTSVVYLRKIPTGVKIVDVWGYHADTTATATSATVGLIDDDGSVNTAFVSAATKSTAVRMNALTAPHTVSVSDDATNRFVAIKAKIITSSLGTSTQIRYFVSYAPITAAD